jgi:hypothetical protein
MMNRIVELERRLEELEIRYGQHERNHVRVKDVNEVRAARETLTLPRKRNASN